MVVSLAAVEHVQVSDYVLHYAGMVIQRLEPDEASAVLELLAEIDALNLEPAPGDRGHAIGGGSGWSGPLRAIRIHAQPPGVLWWR